jgi:hypothetical protein
MAIRFSALLRHSYLCPAFPKIGGVAFSRFDLKGMKLHFCESALVNCTEMAAMSFPLTAP